MGYVGRNYISFGIILITLINDPDADYFYSTQLFHIQLTMR
jgi:hypothetical protein